MSNWESRAEYAENRPFSAAIKVILFIFGLAVVIGIIGYPLGWFSEAASVAKKEFGPSAALEKYEWFKDAAAQLDKKKADIQLYDSRMKAMKETYANLERQKWPREDREQFNLWSSEVSGVAASYNSLAAEYNSGMAKFNWSFANAGDLPKGATEPLPREFKPYINE